jgi:hypothetical protein
VPDDDMHMLPLAARHAVHLSQACLARDSLEDRRSNRSSVPSSHAVPCWCAWCFGINLFNHVSFVSLDPLHDVGRSIGAYGSAADTT